MWDTEDDLPDDGGGSLSKRGRGCRRTCVRPSWNSPEADSKPLARCGSRTHDGYSDAHRADDVSHSGVVVLCTFGMSRNCPRTRPPMRAGADRSGSGCRHFDHAFRPISASLRIAISRFRRVCGSELWPCCTEGPTVVRSGCIPRGTDRIGLRRIHQLPTRVESAHDDLSPTSDILECRLFRHFGRSRDGLPSRSDLQLVYVVVRLRSDGQTHSQQTENGLACLPNRCPDRWFQVVH